MLVLVGCALACAEGSQARPGESASPGPASSNGGYVPPLAESLPAQPDCSDGVFEVSVDLEEQREIDRLEGCTRIVGDAWLLLSEGLDYTPLRTLQDVEGTLSVRGGYTSLEQPLEVLRSLEEAGGLSLLLLTHGHWDHAGGAAQLQKELRAPVALHRADAELARRGVNGLLKPTNFTGRLIRPFVDRSLHQR